MSCLFSTFDHSTSAYLQSRNTDGYVSLLVPAEEERFTGLKGENSGTFAWVRELTSLRLVRAEVDAPNRNYSPITTIVGATL